MKHPLPWKTLANDADPDLGTSRKTGHGKELERIAPAYAEIEWAHRKHLGTGSSAEANRFRQKVGIALKENNSPSNALQLSLLGYAHVPGYRDAVKTADDMIANDSYLNMITKIDSVSYFCLFFSIESILL
ncbi:unnamed protein product [Rotaria sp. Silwood2]|nr:unnamed protein product [Rotaria sp. Silwood2]CAF3178411.1 unnamed protein product [Rotaria sp. Silwood2]CAF4240301.1 unnamed protein product [Rotaria sp. Silwood2]CAF4431702.1 unnamed protein product [Rotaria sp. Silwood2]